MNSTLIKHALIDRGRTLAALSRETGIAYDRLLRVVHNYRKPKPEEVDRIAASLGIAARDLFEE